MSNGPGVTERMLAAKTLLLERLTTGYYPMADGQGSSGIASFLRVSMRAEVAYGRTVAGHPHPLFEDQIEPMLFADPARPLIE